MHYFVNVWCGALSPLDRWQLGRGVCTRERWYSTRKFLFIVLQVMVIVLGVMVILLRLLLVGTPGVVTTISSRVLLPVLRTVEVRFHFGLFVMKIVFFVKAVHRRLVGGRGTHGPNRGPISILTWFTSFKDGHVKFNSFFTWYTLCFLP